jgi:uncharacterized caspase-like protein
MRRIRIAIAALALGILTACAHSAFAAPEQGKRVALVVGNGAYQHARHLKNPENDAAAVADALLRLGFEVRKETDLDKRRFDQVMPEFAEMATGAEIALVYFSGHAMELQGIPYLMPTDAQPISRSHIRNQLKSVRDIVFDLEGVSGLKLVVVDGCRDNPLAANLLRALGLPRSASDTTRGFLSADAERQQLGELIIAFATLQGEPAYDGTELNSPFTTAFLNHVGEDGIEVDQLFRKVKDDVVSATQRMQTPMIESYRGNRTFVLRPGATLPQPASAKSRRLALVIGNSAYLHAPPVKSAVNDAILLSDKLKEVGFEVQLEKNLDGRLIFEKVQQFHAKVDPETEVALIYYTGYGVQFLGQNFLIGIDARPKSQERLFVETFPLNKLIDMFDKRSVATLLFWDACRSHPFTEEYPGVARPPQSKGDTLILLSAEANKQCPEASGEHSVFAEALARHIPTRDVEIETVLKRASAEVRERTQKLQEPERITQLRREFYFRREGPEEAAYQEEIRKQSQLVALQRESAPRKQFKIIGLDQKDSPKSTPAASPPAPWGPTRGPGPGGPPADAAAMKAVAGSETTAAHSASGNVVIEADRAASTIVRKLRISPDGKLLAVGDDEGFIRIVRLESFEVIATIPAHAGRISDLDFSPDSRILLSAGRDRLLRFWDLSNLSRSPVRELKAPGSMPYSARINSNMPDRFVLMGDRDGRVVAWDLKRNHIITNSKFHQGPVNSVAYQPGGNGTYLSAGADGQLKIRLPEGQRLTLHPHNGVMFQASYSASGKLVYTVGADRTAKIWDAAASGRQLAVMSGHFKYVLTADMSPDEKLLVTGGGDKVLNLWDVASGALRGQMKGHTSDIEAVAFSPNGKFVVSASEDKSVIIWSVENQEALATLFFQKNGDKYAGVTFDNQAFGERNSGLLSVYVDGRQVSGPEAERVVRYIGRGIAIIENEN